MTEKQIRNALLLLTESDPNSLKAFVAKEALKHHYIEYFFRDTHQRGCISGVISSLNHYEQTHAFFDTYYEELELLRWRHRKTSDMAILDLQYDLKTALAWFAFEQTAQELALELGI